MSKTNSTDALFLLKQLVEIPSFIGKSNPEGEKRLEEFIRSWFKKNLPNYKLSVFPFEKNRNNLFFYTGECKWIFACHLDTVPPFNTRNLKIQKEDDKLFGLGTKDMKGGIVSTLLALQAASQDKKDSDVGVLFYGDEEYTQKGMRVLAESIQKIPKPKLIISPESKYTLGYGARGIIVVKIGLKGQRAHSSRPNLGIDAIKGFYQIAVDLENKLSRVTELGKTSVTIAELKGGLVMDGEISAHYGTIPDYAEGVLSLRVAQEDLTADKLKKIIIQLTNKRKLTLEKFDTVADYPARISDIKEIQPIIEAINKIEGKVNYSDPVTAGYNDVAIVSQKMNVPLVNFGPFGDNNHNPNEWVSLKSIVKTAEVFYKLLSK